MGYIQKLIERLDLGGRGRFLAIVLQGRIVDDLHRLVSQRSSSRIVNVDVVTAWLRQCECHSVTGR